MVVSYEEDKKNNTSISISFDIKSVVYDICYRECCSISDNDIFKNVRLSFYKLIDFNNDSNYEFVVNKRMSEYGPDYYELYN